MVSRRLSPILRRRADQAAREKQIKDLKFDVNRSIRYHASRQAFYESFDVRINVANLILGSWAVLTLIEGSPFKVLALWQGAVIAALSFINLSIRSAEKSSKHSQFRQRYYDLLRRLQRLEPNAAGYEEQFLSCTDSRLEIERDEPPTNCVLDLVAHNEQVRAQGGSDADVYHVPTFKRISANLVPWDTTQFVTVVEMNRIKAEKKRLKAERKRSRFWGRS